VRNIYIVLLCSLLFACGGGSSSEPVVVEEIPIDDGTSGNGSNGDDDETVTTFTIQTVNHLKEAFVCADLNNNFVCEEDEELGLTDENGAFEVDTTYESNTLLIKSIINQTIDLQAQLGVGQPYTLYAPSPVTVVSPITTIMMDASYTLSSLSSSWGLSEEVLSGDFISMQVGDASTQAIVVTAISNFIRDEIKDEEDISGLVEPIGVAMVDVLVAMETQTDLTNLLFEKDQNGLVVTNLEKPLIEYVDFNNMSGSWKFYHFGGIEDDRFGTVDITENSISSHYCVRVVGLNSGSKFNPMSTRDCTSLSFNEGLMLPGLDDELMLVYGHTSERGTVLIFKATHWQSINKLADGYYWFDNFEDEVSTGRSLKEDQWLSQSFSVLGYAPDGVWDIHTLTATSEAGVRVEYNGVSDEVTEWSMLEQLDKANDMFIWDKHLFYKDANHTKDQIRSVYRQGDFMGLGLHSDDGYSRFNLTSPNSDLISNIEQVTLSTGIVSDFLTF